MLKSNATESVNELRGWLCVGIGWDILRRRPPERDHRASGATVSIPTSRDVRFRELSSGYICVVVVVLVMLVDRSLLATSGATAGIDTWV